MISRVILIATVFFAFCLTITISIAFAQKPEVAENNVVLVAKCYWTEDVKQIYVLGGQEFPKAETSEYKELAKELKEKAGVAIITSGTMGMIYKVYHGRHPLDILDVLNNYFNPHGGNIRVMTGFLLLQSRASPWGECVSPALTLEPAVQKEQADPKPRRPRP